MSKLSEDPVLVDLVIEALGDVQGSADRIVASTVLWALEPHLERREVMARPGTGEDVALPRSPVGTPQPCSDCGGTGSLGSVQDEFPCHRCDGSGWTAPPPTADLLPREALRQVGEWCPLVGQVVSLHRAGECGPEAQHQPVYVIDPEEGTQ